MSDVHVVIADDHALVRQGLRSTIEGMPGFLVVGEAANGREAVAQATKLRPHIVVLDIGMPEMNGIEATGRIREALPQTEVLILTMHESDELTRQALAAGARGFLLKSDETSHIPAALRALAKHQPYFTRTVADSVLKGYLQPPELPHEAGPADRLSAREREVLQLVAEGHTTKEIARALGISAKTVEVHRGSLMSKLDLHSVADLVRYAIRNRVIEP